LAFAIQHPTHGKKRRFPVSIARIAACFCILLAAAACSRHAEDNAVFAALGSGHALRHVHSIAQLQQILESEPLVFVDFYLENCGPCELMGRGIREIAERYRNRMAFVCVNVNDNEWMTHFDIPKVPDLRIYRNGEIAAHWQGFQHTDRIEQKIREILGEK